MTTLLAHRPWWEEIPEFLPENIEPLIHGFRLTRETVAPADLDESLSDNEWPVLFLSQIDVINEGVIEPFTYLSNAPKSGV